MLYPGRLPTDRKAAAHPSAPVMKRRLLVGSVLWTLLVTCLHVWANVGFGTLRKELSSALGLTRPTLRVGFLPVT